MSEASNSNAVDVSYETILFGWLGIDRTFLDDRTKFERVLTRLSDAGDAMHVSQVCFTGRDWAGINMCVHVASAVVLLEARSEQFHEAQRRVNNAEKYRDIDPSTVFTAAALYFVVEDVKKRLSDFQKDLEKELEGKKLEEKEWPQRCLGLGIQQEMEEIQRQIKTIQRQIEEIPEQTKKMNLIRRRFDDINWLVSKDAMDALQIERIEPTQ